MTTKLCRQYSIESPNPAPAESVFCFEVPVPEVPESGALVQVTCAGVCYKKRSSTDGCTPPPSPSIQGIRDSALFPGYEVAGVIDSLGPDVPSDCEISVGDKVVVYPFEQLQLENGYAEYISVPDVKYLVKVPASVPLSVAAMMPTGALWAMNAVHTLTQCVNQYVANNDKCNILIVGTGGLALWTLRIANHLLADHRNDVRLTIAALKDERITLAQEHGRCKVVSWSEEVYESLLIERTLMACKGEVDIALDFGSTPRTISRLIKCMKEGGTVLVGADPLGAEAKHAQQLQSRNISLQAVSMGSLEQLQELMTLVAEGKVIPPKYTVFPVENASEVLRRLSKSQIDGRAVLEFNKTD